MLASAAHLARRLILHATTPPRTCILCGAPLLAPERSLQIRCPTCGHHIHLRDITLTASHVAGRIITAGAITVPAHVSVSGDLLARTVHIQGRVTGDILASDACHLGPVSRVNGNILCAHLHITPGAQLDGYVERIEPRPSFPPARALPPQND